MSYHTLVESVAPSTPTTGKASLYIGTDKKLHLKDDAGTDTAISGGTVTSVAVAVPSFLSVAGSPVTTAGTITVSLATQAANALFAGPTTGSPATPTFRTVVAADLGTGTPDGTKFLRDDLAWVTVPGGSSALLSATHTDTVAAGPTRGDLVVANSTPAWARFAVGASGTVLVGGTDPAWSATPTLTSLTLTGGTITSNAPILNVTRTWNNGAVTFTHLDVNVTDTASAAASLLMDLKVGGSSKFSVRKDGRITAAVDILVPTALYTNSVRTYSGGASPWTFNGPSASYTDVQTGTFIWLRPIGNLVQQSNSSSAQTLHLYETYDDVGTNYERGSLAMGSDTLTIGWQSAGTGAANGGITLLPKGTGSVKIGAPGSTYTAPLVMQVDGVGTGFIVRNSDTEYTLFQSGGVAKGLVGAGTVPFKIQNTGDVFINAGGIESVRFSSTTVTIADTFNVSIGTTTGTKIGTATTQKLGFWNVTPVVQPSTTGEATGYTGGGGTALTHTDTFTGNSGTKAYTLNDIVKHLKAIGILAAS